MFGMKAGCENCKESDQRSDGVFHDYQDNGVSSILLPVDKRLLLWCGHILDRQRSCRRHQCKHISSHFESCMKRRPISL